MIVAGKHYECNCYGFLPIKLCISGILMFAFMAIFCVVTGENSPCTFLRKKRPPTLKYGKLIAIMIIIGIRLT